MIITELATICEENGLMLDHTMRLAMEAYARLLTRWNSKINLISRKDEAHILDRHILHSLTLAMPAISGYDFQNTRVLDIGTGGGLPGIPLKIVIPSLDMTLVDSTQKKIAAVNEMIANLGLTGIRAIAARAEELAKAPEEAHSYDVIISRAVAPLEDLVKWSRELLKPDGVLFSLKGGDLSEEIQLANRLKGVTSIEAKPLDLKGYPDFQREEKKLVRVDFAG
ncbi:MAG TPA: 16S rRNA (guanine(527)-N(7))-methyltransferase RsmG [Candidatus Kapabacteria bacterium]|nr:16S rRNA (guanine(527)-N(7))-methyltransferase RsmG [Candidatus Kapabacteria bacterium]